MRYLTGSGLGMFDDIAVLARIMKSLDGELNAFREWRARQSPEKLIVVERLPATAALLEQEKPRTDGPVLSTRSDAGGTFGVGKSPMTAVKLRPWE